MGASNLSTLNVAIAAARLGGDVLRRKLRRPVQVNRKGFRDIVTDADFAAQAAIVDHLSAAFPQHRLLAEEDPRAVEWSDPTPTWVIDPLDGTSNFARHIPLFAVSIGLARAGTLEVGVIHDPARGETFFAARGSGAFLQTSRGRARPIRVSALDSLADSVIGMGWPRDTALRRRVNAATERVGAACQTLRATGSAALNFAYIACGRMDGLYHLALQPWDVAAGALLVIEAGGHLSLPDGSEWRLGAGQVVASNGALHTELVSAFAWGTA
jgi:myo-inositol-1(or 4)-monophosphatase